MKKKDSTNTISSQKEMHKKEEGNFLLLPKGNYFPKLKNLLICTSIVHHDFFFCLDLMIKKQTMVITCTMISAN